MSRPSSPHGSPAVPPSPPLHSPNLSDRQARTTVSPRGSPTVQRQRSTAAATASDLTGARPRGPNTTQNARLRQLRGNTPNSPSRNSPEHQHREDPVSPLPPSPLLGTQIHHSLPARPTSLPAGSQMVTPHTQPAAAPHGPRPGPNGNYMELAGLLNEEPHQQASLTGADRLAFRQGSATTAPVRPSPTPLIAPVSSPSIPAPRAATVSQVAHDSAVSATATYTATNPQGSVMTAQPHPSPAVATQARQVHQTPAPAYESHGFTGQQAAGHTTAPAHSVIDISGDNTSLPEEGELMEEVSMQSTVQGAATDGPILLNSLQATALMGQVNVVQQAQAETQAVVQARYVTRPMMQPVILEVDVPPTSLNRGDVLAPNSSRWRFEPYPTTMEEVNYAVERFIQHAVNQGWDGHYLQSTRHHPHTRSFDIICTSAEGSRQLCAAVVTVQLNLQANAPPVLFSWMLNGPRHPPTVYTFKFVQEQTADSSMAALPNEAIMPIAIAYCSSIHAESINGCWRDLWRSGLLDSHGEAILLPQNEFTVCANTSVENRHLFPGFFTTVFQGQRVTFKVTFQDRADYCNLHKSDVIHPPGAVCDLRKCFHCHQGGHESRRCPRRLGAATYDSRGVTLTSRGQVANQQQNRQTRRPY
jgi:hypothetical protein